MLLVDAIYLYTLHKSSLNTITKTFLENRLYSMHLFCSADQYYIVFKQNLVKKSVFC